MRQILRAVWWMAAMGMAAVCLSGEKNDPNALAARVAPFVHEKNFVVFHVDLARVDLGAAEKLFSAAPPEIKKDIDLVSAQAAALRKGLLAAGVTDFCGTVGFTELGHLQAPENWILFIVPSSANAKAVADLMKPFKLNVELRGNALVIGTEASLQYVKNIKTETRPELATAFSAAGDAAVSVCFLPPLYWRRVTEEMMPNWPAVLGGGASSRVTRGLLWATLALDFAPSAKARLTLETPDNTAATALRDLCLAGWEGIKRFQIQQKQPLPPGADEWAKRLTPAVQGKRLVVELDASAIPLK